MNQILKIADLPEPIVSAKADWLLASDWLGFTPINDKGPSREKRRSAIAKQSQGGYVLEYITITFGHPNEGFEKDALYLADRETHRGVAGRLVAVHKLKSVAMPLLDILGKSEYDRLQDIWANGKQRYRWSVAFPIVESFEIIEQPLASDIFDKEAMQRIFAHPSSTLRPLNERERGFLANLSIRPRPVRHQSLSIEDEFKKADLSEISSGILRKISKDLSGAYEGITQEEMTKRRRRAAWLAQIYVSERTKAGRLICDDCGFNPEKRTAGTLIRPRSLIDVHHKFPLCEGERLTTIEDFELLCPICHRFEHRLLSMGSSRHDISDTRSRI